MQNASGTVLGVAIMSGVESAHDAQKPNQEPLTITGKRPSAASLQRERDYMQWRLGEHGDDSQWPHQGRRRARRRPAVAPAPLRVRLPQQDVGAGF